MIRTFIAVDVPSCLRERVEKLQSGFKGLGLDAKWVAPDNFHLTLKFLGDVPLERLPALQAGLEESLASASCIAVSLGGAGVFPDARKPRVLWVALEPAAEFEPLFRAVEESAARLGFPREPRKFTPHLTLARIKSPRNATRLQEALRQAAAPERTPPAGEITAVRLYSSQLTPRGSIYTVLKEFPLRRCGQGG